MTNNTKLRVDGIFFDETPSEYVKEKYDYLKTASQTVKNATGFRDRFVGMYLLLCQRCSLVNLTVLMTYHAVHNPGNITSFISSPSILQQSYMNLSDITVVYEEAFDKWLDKNTFQALQAHKVRRSKLAVILHSIPNISRKVLDFVVEQVEETADWLYLTDIKTKDEYYHSFSPLFGDMVKAVDGR